MSDHYPCLLVHKLNFVRNKQNIVLEKRKIDDNALAKIQRDLLFHDWSYLDNGDLTVNESYQYFANIIEGVLDTRAPLKCIVICNDDKFREPWITVSIKKCNRKCRVLCNRAKTTGDESDHA